jgi:hypothetical protein
LDKDERFDKPEEFEEKILSGKIIDDDILDVIKRANKPANYGDNNTDNRRGARKIRLPKETQAVFDLAKKRFE